MQPPRLRLGLVLSTSLLVASLAACGGSANEGRGAASPDGSPAPAEREAPPSPASDEAAGEADATAELPPGGRTTTTELGERGDLQGAKLGDKVHTVTETKGEGGPKSTKGQSANEPGRSVKDIAAIIAARRDEARACYDKGLESHPGISGDLDVKWVIDPEGNVTEAFVDTAKSSILEPGVGSCVVDVIKSIKFAPSPGGYETRAQYPFNFQPRRATKK